MIPIASLEEGIPYRINELAEIIGKTRPTIERYIERFSIECVQVEHCGKMVNAAVLNAENIKQLMTVSNGGSERVSNGDRDLSPLIIENPSEVDRDPLQSDRDLLISSLESRLAETTAKMEGFKALLDERERLISSKESEINTLKTALLILERKDQAQTTNLIPERRGILGKVKDWLRLSH